MRQRNRSIRLNTTVALVPPGFEAVVRDQRQVGIADNVLDETEARSMTLPRMGLDIKKIVNEIFKRAQPVPSDSVPQEQSHNVECDHQSSTNVVAEMVGTSMSLPNVISDFEKQVTDEAVESVQDVRPMDETEELRRPNDEAGTVPSDSVPQVQSQDVMCNQSSLANVVAEMEEKSMNLPNVISDFEKQVTEVVQSVQDVRPMDEPEDSRRPNDKAGTKHRILKVYTRRKRPNDEAGTKQRILKVYTRRKRPNAEAGTKRILKVYTRRKRPNDEAGTKKILKVYTRKKWRGGQRPNQHDTTTVADKADKV